jgi:hypothetical protein
MVCSGLNENDYIGTTDVCKSGTNWAAGCCCNSIAGRMITAITGGTNPGATGKADGQSCAAASECSSGYCSYTFCVSDSSHCGGITGSMNYADGAKASNQWLDGICRFGVWKVTDNGIGCDSFKCDNGNATCVSNKCVVSNPTAKKTNGESCAAASECSSGICSYTFCVQNSTDCGGVSGSMDYANGKFASNQWFGGYCRNGVWKVATGNIGCGGDLSFPCDSGSCVNNKCQ